MSKARDAIIKVIGSEWTGLSGDTVEYLADELMVIVCDTVARGFENAADALIELDDEPHAARHLRRWAKDARQQP